MSAALASNAGPVMILAGGTGGHIFPGIAVAHALREAGVEVRWLGADGGMETRLVPPQGIALDTIPVKGVRGKGAAALLGLPWRLGRALSAARAVLRAQRPRAVVSFGGYVAGPGGLAARALGVPLLVHEQNRAAGMTNRVLARIARRVLTGFPGTFANEVAVGNPVRDVITAVAPPAERLAGREGALRILVIGGSQGAQALNTGAPKALAAAPLTAEVRHQCGERQADAAREAYQEAGVAASIEPFIADMAAAYAWADLVICRAGALTLAELCAVGVPGILVPLPTAVDDHQTRNAHYLVDGGAALLVAQGERFEQRLADAIQTLGRDPPRRRSMADAARALARPDAARDVARHILEVAA